MGKKSFVVSVIDPITKIEYKYSMLLKLKKNLDKIKDLLKYRDKDYLLVVDGAEGAGKSTLALQVGRYVDPTLDLSRVCMTPQEFRSAIIKAQSKQCVIYDESVTGLLSRSATSRINRMLVSLMMQMRQKNLFVIVIIPTFFMLDKYVALFRSKALIHVTEKNERYTFHVFNKKYKQMLYLQGAKTLSYGKTIAMTGLDFRGEFFGKYAINEEAYRKKKIDALKLLEEDIESENKYLEQRNQLIYLLDKQTKLTLSEMEELFLKNGIQNLKRSSIGMIIKDQKEVKNVKRRLN